ncbi:MAG: hypothetical protein OXB86_01480 [Bdellovibrionales bacterium]|nr:hypothetical protein [Bdellovibrionales bacterium]
MKPSEENRKIRETFSQVKSTDRHFATERLSADPVSNPNSLLPPALL